MIKINELTRDQAAAIIRWNENGNDTMEGDETLEDLLPTIQMYLSESRNPDEMWHFLCKGAGLTSWAYGQKLHFKEGQLFTTLHDRPEQLIFTVDDAAKRLVFNLDPEWVAYARDPARGEFMGFAALHDKCDANMLLPGANDPRFLEEDTKDVYVEFCNAVMEEVNRLLLK